MGRASEAPFEGDELPASSALRPPSLGLCGSIVLGVSRSLGLPLSIPGDPDALEIFLGPETDQLVRLISDPLVQIGVSRQGAPGCSSLLKDFGACGLRLLFEAHNLLSRQSVESGKGAKRVAETVQLLQSTTNVLPSGGQPSAGLIRSRRRSREPCRWLR